MESPYQRLEQAQAFADQGAWEKALPILEGLAPFLRGEGLFLLASCARECGRFELALKAGQAYAEAEKGLAAYLFVATTALRIPDHKQADQALEAAHKVCPGPENSFFEPILRLRALVGEVLGEEADIFERAREWYQNYPNTDKAIAFYLQQLYIRQEYSEALRLARHHCTADQKLWRVWGAYASAAHSLGEHEEALRAYRTAYELEGRVDLGSNVLYCLLNVDSIDEAMIEQEHVKICQALWPGNGASRMPALYRQGPNRPWDGHRRLRIGYVSGDFSFHSVGSFLISLIEKHDRSRFEICCYSTRRNDDDMEIRFRALSDRWRDVTGLDDDAIAQRIVEDEVDILIDLGGHTSTSCLGVFARRPAPVQVTWLGYPEITGLAAMDARMADRIVDPCDSAGHPPVALSGERIVHLPHGYHCWRPLVACPEVSPLPDGPPVLGYYGAFSKVSPTTLALWAAALKAVPEAHLRLKGRGFDNEGNRQYLFNKFSAMGISQERLTLVPWSTYKSHHMEAYQDIHLALDPTPYNGTTTVCEALWMGVPTLSLRGPARRRSALVTESLYTAIGQDVVEQFIAADEQDYVNKVVALLRDRSRLGQWRASLRQRVEDSPLRDEAGFARDFEAALVGLIKDLGR